MLPKKYRLSKNDIEKVFKVKKRFQGNFLLLKIKPNSLPFSRFSVIVPISVSKKSSQRNRIKRLIRESLRKKLVKIKPGIDGILMANPKILGRGYWEIDEEIKKILIEAKIINSR
jgi:ribonuclease P protein component